MNKNMQHPHQKFQVREDGSLNIVTINTEKSMTQQQFKEECDINNIVKRHADAGFQIPEPSKGVYADLTQLGNYQEMLEKVDAADAAFMSLDAKTRAKFENNPHNLIQFLSNPQNLEEAIKLGLVEKPKPDVQREILNELKNQSKSKIQNDNKNAKNSDT